MLKVTESFKQRDGTIAKGTGLFNTETYAIEYFTSKNDSPHFFIEFDNGERIECVYHRGNVVDYLYLPIEEEEKPTDETNPV